MKQVLGSLKSFATNKGGKVSLLTALSINRFAACKIFDGSVNTAIFDDFMINSLLPVLRYNKIVIMDNAGIHKSYA